MNGFIVIQHQTGSGGPVILIMLASIFFVVALVVLAIIAVCRDYYKAKQNRPKNASLTTTKAQKTLKNKSK